MSDMENKRMFYDAKTRLQEIVQHLELGDINYELLDERGPDHNKHFFVEVRIGTRSYGQGDAQNRKSAEQKAAYAALLKLHAQYPETAMQLNGDK